MRWCCFDGGNGGWTYTGHEETEGTTKCETHCTGDDGLDGARLHTGLHLMRNAC